EDRVFVDVRREWRAGPRLTLTFSDRLNVRVENDLAFPTRQNVVNDWRGGVLGWGIFANTDVGAGCINLKGGAGPGVKPHRLFQDAGRRRAAFGRSVGSARGSTRNADASRTAHLDRWRTDRRVRAGGLSHELDLLQHQLAIRWPFIRSNERPRATAREGEHQRGGRLQP